MAESATLTMEERKAKCLLILADAENLRETKLDDAVELLYNLQPVLNTFEVPFPQVRRTGEFAQLALTNMNLGKRAQALYIIGEYALALEAYEELKNFTPGNIMVTKARGDCYRKLQQCDKALEIYKEQLINLEGQGPSGLKARGPILNSQALCYLAQGKMHLALATFKEAWSLEKNNILYMCNYAKLLLGTDDGEQEALDLFKKAYELTKDEKNMILIGLTKNNAGYICKTLEEIIEVGQLAQDVAQLAKEAKTISSGSDKLRQACLRLKILKNQNAARAQKALGEPEDHLDALALHRSESVVMDITHLKALKQEMEELKETLALKADNYDKAIQNSIKHLPAESREKIMEFHGAFLSTFDEVFTKSQLIECGSFKFETGSNAGSVISTLASFMPATSDKTSQVVSTVDEFMSAAEIKTNARKIIQFARDHSHLLMLLSDTTNKIVNNAYYQKKIIDANDANLEPKITATISNIKNLITEISDQIDYSLYGLIYDTPAAKLGNIEASNLIEKILQGEVTNDAASLSESVLRENLGSLKNSTAAKATSVPQPGSPAPVGVNRKATCCNIF